jgi:hypothetical protein
VRTFSVDYSRIRRLDHLIVGEGDAAAAVAAVCERAGVPLPALRFHARRSPFTGACEAPRSSTPDGLAIAGGRDHPSAARRTEHGAIRLGRSVTLMTLAHELGHHLVHHLDDPGTPAHGKLWVLRFDQAAAVIDDLIET